ncbi:MAG: hypothetical protein KU28_01020 [Sulfurovum sp. PC08-66]|nr:MAG: hypothetical protein KU28_01020 [Sulfurovum sp. PC08-66]KIM12538.1 MAG: hypothetical protein KU37_01135 [Sulfuricurvum sp. PC08-66]
MSKKYTAADFPLELTYTIEAALKRYFIVSHKAMHLFDTYAHRHKRIDFKLMHRFLHTTYKTLRELDPEFMAHKLAQRYKNLLEMAKVYEDFLTKSRNGASAYEMIFLAQQKGFVTLEEKLTANTEEIGFLRGQTRRFKENVKELTQKIQNASKMSGEYGELVEELKRVKRHENNAIVRLGDLVDQNEVLYEVITQFRDQYEAPFLRDFSHFVHDTKPKLKAILDAMAYAFDIELWFKAKESPIIRNYFKNAYTGEIISSRTYLEYYLKNLDVHKLNKENQALQQLYLELKKVKPLNILIIIADEGEGRYIKNALHADGAGHKTTVIGSTFEASMQHHPAPYEVIFVDVAGSEDIASFAHEARRNPLLCTIDTLFIAVGAVLDEREVAVAQSIQAASLIARDVEAVEILDTLYEAVDNQKAKA